MNFRMIKLDATGTVHRGKSRNKKFREGDIVSFQAIEKEGDLRAWKISKLEPDND